MRKLLILSFFSFFSLYSLAQVRLGVFGGLSNYQGDLVDKLFKSSRGAFGFTATFPVSDRFSIRTGLTFAKVAGADSLGKASLKPRNLSFQSAITELSVVGEYTFFNIEQTRWSPYIFAGLAVYHFNPYTFDRSGNKVFLQPLSTEGQGLPGYSTKPYSLTQLAIPFGGGVKFAISDKVQIGFETGLRKLFTDYLDDVSGNYANAADLFAGRGSQSVDMAYRGNELPGGNQSMPSKGQQRGSPKYKDYYYFTGLHLTFQLGEGGDGLFSGKGKKGYGCPSVRL